MVKFSHVYGKVELEPCCGPFSSWAQTFCAVSRFDQKLKAAEKRGQLCVQQLFPARESGNFNLFSPLGSTDTSSSEKDLRKIQMKISKYHNLFRTHLLPQQSLTYQMLKSTANDMWR